MTPRETDTATGTCAGRILSERGGCALDGAGSPLVTLVAALLLFCGTGAASATSATHPHAEIAGIVERAAIDSARDRGHEDIEVRVHPLDPRLRPSRCDAPLEIVRPHAGRVLGPVSYGVRCPGNKPWTLYLRADVSAGITLPVAGGPLPRGAIIGEGDLEIAERRISSAPADIVLDSAQLVGHELRRSLAAGSSFRHGDITRPKLISRGQTVTIVSGRPGLQVRMQGKAMSAAAVGERVQVANTRSGRRVEGVVLADGSVRID